ncbi:pimeloyl-ACP methyl ester carboxylesterase [Streptosporangium becharense]|uniref:Pimeloyl-ACP methyl ester carboxylesterase n=1 Tax=Streptosporangium becharense TaxID=1816182 RepID=A0A7W9IHS3_9ACTN|nr:alpha/beta hydrolase [Streptosporangium becharense]MBB2912500.1 pimeloyl-ACP methyl ester carboxylesterase [Streptosporangium becharense]MBB5820670.1 pimeloyl-ACP methyl ester carboxylesterase [Streptosporangium becharense]
MKYGITEADRIGQTELPDGRRLGWAEWGPEDGVPVLFLSGAAMGRSLGFGGDVVAGRGIRLVSLERPGLGASDPDPGRTLDGWAADVEAFLSARGLGRVPVVGFSQGAPFALACAAAGVVRSVAVVAGQDELTHPDLSGLLDPHLAGMMAAIGADPEGFAASFAEKADAEGMWQLIVSMSSDLDRAVYTDPAFEGHYRRALAEGFAQGAAGYTRDLVLAMSRWPFDVAGITVPVDLWYGGHDTSTVHSPDHGATLARRIPGARRHLLPEAGGSVLWTHAEEILTALV